MSRDLPGTSNTFLTTAAGAAYSASTLSAGGWVFLDTIPGAGLTVGAGMPSLFTHKYASNPLPLSISVANTNDWPGTVDRRWGANGYSGSAWGTCAIDTVQAPVGSWTHIFATRNGNTNVKFYRDGVLRGTGTPAAYNATTQVLHVGVRWDSETGTSTRLDGRVSRLGWWNAELNATEVAALAAGASPLMVRPSALVSYWPLWGLGSAEPDWKGGAALTQSGTVAGSTAEPPRVAIPLLTAASL